MSGGEGGEGSPQTQEKSHERQMLDRVREVLGKKRHAILIGKEEQQLVIDKSGGSTSRLGAFAVTIGVSPVPLPEMYELRLNGGLVTHGKKEPELLMITAPPVYRSSGTNLGRMDKSTSEYAAKFSQALAQFKPQQRLSGSTPK